MKKVAWGLSVVALVVGCGSSSGSSDDPFGPDPDFAAVQQHLKQPDGTLNAGNVGSVLARASSDGTSPVYGGDTSSSNGGTTTQSIRPLGGSAFGTCQALYQGQRSGSCACPDGGSLAWDISGDRQAATMRFRMDQCASDGAVIDGREFLQFAAQQNGNGNTYDGSMLFVAHMTVTRAAVTHTIDVEESWGDGKLEVAVKVDDGWVVVAIATAGDGQNGTFTVHDKNGTWSCVVDNGKGTCTSDNGAPPVQFQN